MKKLISFLFCAFVALILAEQAYLAYKTYSERYVSIDSFKMGE